MFVIVQVFMEFNNNLFVTESRFSVKFIFVSGKLVVKPNAQQQLQEMANFVVNSRLLFARNIILVENMQFRSSPLLVAAKR